MAATIATHRATAGLIQDLVDLAYDHYEATGSWAGVGGAVSDGLAQQAIDRFEPKIRHGFARAGVDLPDGPLTVATLKQVVGDRLGVEPDDMTPEGIKAVFDAKLSEALSNDTGLNLTSVLSAGIQDAIRAEVIRAIVDGRAAALLDRHLMSRARKLAAMKQAGYTDRENQRKMLLRLYQTRYRRNNRYVWDK